MYISNPSSLVQDVGNNRKPGPEGFIQAVLWLTIEPTENYENCQTPSLCRDNIFVCFVRWTIQSPEGFILKEVAFFFLQHGDIFMSPHRNSEGWRHNVDTHCTYMNVICQECSEGFSSNCRHFHSHLRIKWLNCGGQVSKVKATLSDVIQTLIFTCIGAFSCK